MTTTTHHATWARDLAADINNATRAIIMTALSMLPPRTIKTDDMSRFWLALAAATSRGVAIQVALPQPSLAHPATLRNEAAARDLAGIGAACILVPPQSLLHAKTIVIDATIAWVGSGNFTAAAVAHNRECYLRTTDERAVAELAGFHAQTFNAGKVWP